MTPQRRRLLLVAGAAAGVAAIFKAPATGAVFALEVPYQDDLARRMLLPALVASASGYLTFVAIHGTTALLTVTGTPPFSFKDLAAAAALGIIAGVGARGFAWMLRRAKHIAAHVSVWVRVPAVGAGLAGIFCLARLVGGLPRRRLPRPPRRRRRSNRPTRLHRPRPHRRSRRRADHGQVVGDRLPARSDRGTRPRTRRRIFGRR